MKNKLEDFKALIKRNKLGSQNKCLNFPFLIIEPSCLEGTTINLMMQSNFKKLCINSNNEMNLHGDLEIISILRKNAEYNNY